MHEIGIEHVALNSTCVTIVYWGVMMCAMCVRCEAAIEMTIYLKVGPIFTLHTRNYLLYLYFSFGIIDHVQRAPYTVHTLTLLHFILLYIFIFF